AADLGIAKLIAAERQSVGPVGRLGNRPAADERALLVIDERLYVLVDQPFIATQRGQCEREAGHRDAEREVGAPPAHLLEKNVQSQAAQTQTAEFRRRSHRVITQTVGGTED